MDLEKYSMKEANKLIKQRFNDFMKAEGFVKQKRTTSQFFRVKEHFIQHFWLNISSHVPEIECYIYPVLLFFIIQGIYIRMQQEGGERHADRAEG